MPPLDAQPTETMVRQSHDDASTVTTEAGEAGNANAASQTSPQVNRRQFMTLMGASAALAGLTACRWPVENIAPYAGNDEAQIPGMPRRFATMMDLGGVAAGLVVTSYDGRPVKIEGNPDHPVSGGATTPIQQATILDMYDPDRSQQVLNNGQASSWAAFQAFITGQAGRMPQGEGLAVLAESSSSPTQMALRAKLAAKFPKMRWVTYDSVARENERDGAKMAFGKAVRTHLHCGNAKTILAFDGDLFDMHHPAAIRHAREFMTNRRVSVEQRNGAVKFHDAGGNPVANSLGMSRLYAIESTWSHTGSMADHRFAVRSSEIPMLVQALANMLGVENVPEAGGMKETIDAVQLGTIADDLRAAGKNAMVCAGAGQPAAVHALCHAINAKLGAVGTTVTYTAEGEANGGANQLAAMTDLAAAIDSGSVMTLLVLGGNPAYDAPADLKFAEKIDAVKARAHGAVIHHGVFFNYHETAAKADWHLPATHFLEAWGDGRAWDGSICMQQPLIQPLYEGKSTIELLALLLGEGPTRGYDLVRNNLKATLGNLGAAWRQALHVGVIAGTGAAAVNPGKVNVAGVITHIPAPAPVAKGTSEMAPCELSFTVDARIHDGRYVNNGWLVELPQFFTNLTWDNALLISPAQADAMKIKTGDLLDVTVGEQSIEVAAWVFPGQATNSAAIWLGFGRTHRAQNIHTPIEARDIKVGFSAEPLRTSGAYHTAAATVRRLNKKYPLSATQAPFGIDALGFHETQKRVPSLIRETTVENYQKDPGFVDFVDHIPAPAQLSGLHDYSEWLRPGETIKQPGRGKELVKDYNQGQQWGMAIDLSTCIGCGSCVAACNAENNIPVVGKDEIRIGREMHWLRVDRYFAGDDMVQPPVAHQPMTCIQCENAPCEQVCPVTATSHSDEGTNDMVYNRCIGTRYCMNNCPIKVRKFNFFWNQQNLTEVMKMRFNPQVTVRTRGVMEKCSYCQQRIQAAKIEARTSGHMKTEVQRKLVDGVLTDVSIAKPDMADGTIITACQQSCPTHAIVFGDLNEYDREHPEDSTKWSAVRRLQHRNHSYGLLDQLYLRPRTQYLARVRNPNTKIRSANGAAAPDAGHDDHSG